MKISRSKIGIMMIVVCIETIYSSCITKNPFLTLLKQYDVQIYDNPLPNAIQCKGEWDSHGTCCEPISLEKYTKDKLHQVSRLIDFSRGVFESVSKKLNDVCRVLLLTQFKRGGCDDIGNGPIKQIYQVVDHFSKIVSDGKSRCIKKVKTIRNNALCSVCSGNSQNYVEGAKIKLWNTDCLSIIDECREFWQMALKLLTKIQDLREKVGDSGFEGVLMKVFRNDKMKEYIDYYSGKSVLYHINRCEGSADCPIDSQIAICDTLVSLLNPSFFQIFKKILKHSPSQPDYSISSIEELTTTSAENPSTNDKKTHVVSKVTAPITVANNPLNIIAKGIGNWRLKRLLQKGKKEENSFTTPAGGQFDFIQQSCTKISDVSTVCTHSVIGCRKSPVAMNFDISFP